MVSLSECLLSCTHVQIRMVARKLTQLLLRNWVVTFFLMCKSSITSLWEWNTFRIIFASTIFVATYLIPSHVLWTFAWKGAEHRVLILPLIGNSIPPIFPSQSDLKKQFWWLPTINVYSKQFCLKFLWTNPYF